MTTYREGLLAAARECKDLAEAWDSVVGKGAKKDGLGSAVLLLCQQAILALAEQEDQRGAAAEDCHMSGRAQGQRSAYADQHEAVRPQSAPHPDPAGQASSHKDADEGTGEPMRPALPGPDSVSAAAGAAAMPCCGEYATCMRACVPRGEWIAEERIRQRGLVSVPREPTEAMRLAGAVAIQEHYRRDGGWCGLAAAQEQMLLTWQAMLAAGSAK